MADPARKITNLIKKNIDKELLKAATALKLGMAPLKMM